MNPDALTSARNDLLDALEHNDELRARLTAAEAERDEAVELLRDTSWVDPQGDWGERLGAFLARLRDRST